MRIVELTTGIKLPINNEEASLLKKFAGNTEVNKKDLSERDQYLANKLVEKDVLNRKNKDGKIVYYKRIND